MSEEFLDHQELGPIVNLHNQAVAVVPDVENQKRLVLVGIRKTPANIVEIRPNGAAGRFGPGEQFVGRIHMKSRIPLDGRRADHVHLPILA